MSSSSVGDRGSCIPRYHNWKCKCNVVVEIKVANTIRNPYRLFYTCKYNQCNLFAWCDPTHCDDAISDGRVVEDLSNDQGARPYEFEREVYDINRRLSMLEASMSYMRSLVSILIILLVVICAVFVVVVVN